MLWETIAILNGEMFGISIIKFSRDRYKIVNLNLKKKRRWAEREIVSAAHCRKPQVYNKGQNQELTVLCCKENKRKSGCGVY